MVIVFPGEKNVSLEISKGILSAPQAKKIFGPTFPTLSLIPGINNSGGGNDFRNLHFCFNSGNSLLSGTVLRSRVVDTGVGDTDWPKEIASEVHPLELGARGARGTSWAAWITLHPASPTLPPTW